MPSEVRVPVDTDLAVLEVDAPHHRAMHERHQPLALAAHDEHVVRTRRDQPLDSSELQALEVADEQPLEVRPVVLTRRGRRQLVLNFEWDSGNAARLPATVLLLRRYVESVRDAQAGAYAANFDADALVPLAERDRVAEPAAEWTLAVDGRGAPRGVRRQELSVLRAPAEAGFFTVRRGDEEIALTYSEFEILNKLASSPRRVFTREELMNHLWKGNFYGDLRSVDVHVRHLRQKVEEEPSEPVLIRTVRGVGYAFGGEDGRAT